MSELVAFEISNYAEVFEVSQSKKYTATKWFPSPNKYDSGGMLETLEEDDGLKFIGIWYLLLQLASTMPKRGLFVSDSGVALTLKRIAITLRIDKKDLENGVNHFIKIGWLKGATPSVLGASYEQTRSELGAREDKRREEEIRKENKEILVIPAESPHPQKKALLESYKKGFEIWWNKYDKKTHKADAEKQWLKLSVEEMKKCVSVVDEYTSVNPKQYRKDPHRYLMKKTFNDEIIHEEDSERIAGEKRMAEMMKNLADRKRLRIEQEEIDDPKEIRRIVTEALC